MSDLGLRGDAGESDNLVAPVELVGLIRREGERYEHTRGGGRMLRETALRVSAHRVVAAGITFHPQPLEQAREAEALAFGLGQLLGQHGVEARDVPVELRAGWCWRL